MSLDVYLRVPGCEHCGRGAETVYDWNYTYNVSRMLFEAAKDAGLDEYVADGHMLAGIEGPAGKYIQTLEKIIDTMSSDRPKYRVFNPENGWGDCDSLIEHLRELLEKLRDYPDATVETWR